MQRDNTAPRPALWAQQIGDTAHALRKTLWARLSDGITQMQIARMTSVLSGLSDAELARIGITRKDIPDHAAYLVGYEYDGL